MTEAERSEAWLDILGSTARMQRQIADILEAKAYETEKARAWICGHLHESRYGTGEDLCKQSMELHDSVVEVIEGITRMELGLYKNLNTLLGQQDGGVSAGGFDFFGGSGEDA